MLKFAPLFLVFVVALAIYCISATSVFPKILLFAASMLLFLSLLDRSRKSRIVRH